MLASLFPLLCQSVDWFEDLVGKQRAMSEVRSSELEKGLSSSNDPVKVEEDIVASSLWEIKAFHTLGEVCGLDIKTLSRFRDRFQLPERVKVRLPHGKEQACHFSPREVCFYELLSYAGLDSPSTPSSWSF